MKQPQQSETFDTLLQAARADYRQLKYAGPALQPVRRPERPPGLLQAIGSRAGRWMPAAAALAVVTLLVVGTQQPEWPSSSESVRPVLSPLQAMSAARSALSPTASLRTPERPQIELYRMPPPPERPGGFAAQTEEPQSPDLGVLHPAITVRSVG